ncbi:hypothetical protein [Chryseobacterium indoltheticum]|uniref:Uncharacterized protein n=1 Tax=Chryseobacterium indoltheticum TaxID=254 RepID=A0A381FJB0_9FLAO|nr:hypothetical protein [Chryseobacterium indoltheticum]SUX46630.1 Uncharacterised protein [Chryseobacterium indoltheticum]
MKNKKEILEYLSVKLNEFIINFPQTKISATIHDSAVVFIQILPNSTYFSDENYVKWEDRIMDEFLEKYPYYNISFLTDSNIFINITRWDVIFVGSLFDKPLGILTSNISLFEISSFNCTDFSTKMKIKSVKQDDYFSTHYTKQKYVNFDFCNNNHKKIENIDIMTINNISENNIHPTVSNRNIISHVVNTEEVILAA